MRDGIDAPAVALRVNGAETAVAMPPGTRLSAALRDGLGLTGTKVGCDAGDCGACTVLLDGEPACACLVPLAQAEGAEVTTVEGLAAPRLAEAFLRHGAAQCGACTPGMLVAASALLARDPAPDRRAVEDALGGVLCRCTGYARIVAAVLDAAGPPGREAAGPPGGGAEAQRPAPQAGGARGACAMAGAPAPEAGRAVGAPIAHLDGPAKVAGTLRFGADAVPEGALRLRAVRSPHHRARFAFGDLRAWAAERAAVVLTAADVPGENRHGVIPPFADQPVLAEREVRHRGEAVALVIGADPADVPVTWEPLPHALSPAEARDAPPIHEERPGNVLARGLVERGDVERGLAEGAHRARIRCTTPSVEHAYIEPEAGWAVREGDRIAIHACTQAAHMDREGIAAILGLPLDAVRVVPTACGGGFGSKLDLSLQPLLALAAWRTGRPVAMAYTRAESMASTTKRHPSEIEVEVACDAQGRLTAMAFEGIFDTGAYASWGPTVANRVPVHASGPYRVPHYRARSVAIHTNGPPSGAFRGFGVPQSAVAQEQAFDALADACGMDRLEFRLLNALRDGEPTVTGQVFGAGVGIAACLDALRGPWMAARAACEAGGATAPRSDPTAPSDRPGAMGAVASDPRDPADGTPPAAAAARLPARAGEPPGRWRRGVGLGTCWYGCGNTSLPNPSTIRMGITARGRVVLHQGAQDIGQGSDTVIAQIAADALGVPVHALSLVGGDTDRTPDAGKTSASRQTFVTGRAAKAAGEALRARILRLANAGPDAAIALHGPRLTIGPAEIDLARLPGDPYVLEATETYDPPTTPLDARGQGSPYAVYGYGAQMAELSVDMELGRVRLHRIVTAHDVGRAINPMLCEAQIEGGAAQGIGLALMEAYLPGRTENLHDYLIPTIGDVPEFEHHLIEVPDPEGPHGAKGLGEHALIPTAPAILNAIRDAVGAPVRDLPATPDKVLAAIREGGRA